MFVSEAVGAPAGPGHAGQAAGGANLVPLGAACPQHPSGALGSLQTLSGSSRQRENAPAGSDPPCSVVFG